MKKKKSMLMLLSAMMIVTLGLSACSGNNGGNNEPSPAASNAGASEKPSEAPPEEEEPTEITIMLPLNIAETPPDTIKTELEKLTNTKLTYQFFPADTYEEKLNASFATGALPQVTYLKNQATFIRFKEAIRDNQFWEIGPYLGEFENLSKMKESILNNTKVDGKLYSLYIGRPLARQGLIYRKDWADNLGLSAPQTTEDLFAMAKAFTEDDPDKDGNDNTVGLADRNDLIYGAFKTLSSFFGTPNNFGVKDGQILPEFMFPEYIETMDYMKSLRDAGYMNQDFAATSKTDQVNLFQSGEAGLYIGSMQDVNSLYNNLVKNVPTAEVATHNKIVKPGGTFGIWAIPGYNNVVLFPKSAIKDEAELKKILAFFDKMMTPEVANLMYWGIEGTHYSVVEGQAKASDDSDKVEREVKGYKDSVIGEPETNGQLQGFHDLQARIDAEKFIIENEAAAIHDPTAPLDSVTFTEQGQELQKIITDATYQYMYGQLDKAGFEKAVETWKERGGQKIIDEFTAAYNASK
ncbi:extracellular solute-binding protein [Paenibacillus soyae]|uniref:Extracellular solute-binding protein n=1 Tax=Paenibacillus soyae TaxID=2969249 RepID=A0A9X2SCE4_9BACL|nr:extracellular solute-binding protein [Paenibacillus soyae]MCR2805972.1 extracellular solute-binding protein [Paenibacillus soyae]